MRRTTLFAASLTLFIACGLTACKGKQTPADNPPVESTAGGGGEAEAPKTVSVVLYDYKFNPNSRAVPVGTTVVFQNKDPEQHNVSIVSLNIDEMLKTNEAVEVTFNQPGTYKVTNRTSRNPMQMTIVVNE